ncbi:hypothetical protein [Halosimplex sp. J119]
MKHIILSEGENDLIFLREVVKETHHPEEYDLFHNEQAQIPQKRRIEHCLLQDNLRSLIKAEGGYNKVAGMFPEIAFQFYNNSIELTVMVDLDNDPFSSCIDDINNELTKDWQNSIHVFCEERTNFEDLCTAKCVLEIEGHGKKNFNIISFYSELEDCLDIFPTDSEYDKIQKSKEYLSLENDGVNGIKSMIA